jgi:hypothetical protein
LDVVTTGSSRGGHAQAAAGSFFEPEVAGYELCFDPADQEDKELALSKVRKLAACDRRKTRVYQATATCEAVAFDLRIVALSNPWRRPVACDSHKGMNSRRD